MSILFFSITALFSFAGGFMACFLLSRSAAADAERHSAILGQAVKRFLRDCDKAAYEGHPEHFQAISPATITYAEQALQAYDTFTESE